MGFRHMGSGPPLKWRGGNGVVWGAFLFPQACLDIARAGAGIDVSIFSE